MLTLAKYSIGMGDRFAHQARPNLRACTGRPGARRRGHSGLEQVEPRAHDHRLGAGERLRVAADAAVRELGWQHPYHVDADHIRLDTVDRFLSPCDFFTIDVADSIGQPATAAIDQAIRRKAPGSRRAVSKSPASASRFRFARSTSSASPRST